MTILTARAHQVLTALETNDDLDSLTSALTLDRSFVQQTIAHLIDVGLVIGVGEGAYDLTPSGRRVLARAHGGSAAESYELDSAVLQALEAFQLRPDREAALRAAYLFLKYWGAATQSEIKDAIYREHPAGYDTPADWWTSLMGEKLHEIPHVSAPDADDIALWRFTGSTVREHSVDGRHVARTYGSVRHAIEHLTRSGPERTRSGRRSPTSSATGAARDETSSSRCS